MTEAEWLAGDDGSRERAALGLGPRRCRLLAVAACRTLPGVAGRSDVAMAVEAAERFADTGQTKGAMRRARRAVADTRITLDESDHRSASAMWAVESVVTVGKFAETLALVRSVRGAGLETADLDVMRDLYRHYAEIAGPPSVALDPAWRTAAVAAIAAGIYADRAFDRLPVLADAFEDAGCDSEPLLAHLRGPGPHARGCWALDLVLGKA